MEIIKDDLTFKEVEYEIAKEMIIKNHYSHKWNDLGFGIVNIGVFKNNECLGVAVFGSMMNPDSYKNICDLFNENSVLELNRMWLDDSLGRNSESMLLSASFKIIKSIRPWVKLINTFSDGRLGCGIVYQACSFDYVGYETSWFIKDKTTGEVYHQQCSNNCSSSPKTVAYINKQFCLNNIECFETRTYRYIKILDKRCRKHIKLEILPYPKNQKEVWDVEYQYTKELLARALILNRLFGDEEGVIAINSFLHNKLNLSKEEIKKLITDEMNSNESINKKIKIVRKKKGE